MLHHKISARMEGEKWPFSLYFESCTHRIPSRESRNEGDGINKTIAAELACSGKLGRGEARVFATQMLANHWSPFTTHLTV